LQIGPFSTRYFSFEIREPIPKKADNWGFKVLSAKGYLATK
jgi:hypothetical protein